VVVGGAALGIWALRTFHHRGTTHDPFGTPTSLVTTGPYRFSRNPMYVALTTVLVGVGLLVGTLPLLLVPVAFALLIHLLYVPYEEAKLEALFGEPYRDLRRRVPRWLGPVRAQATNIASP
jgi:protein-S-isoprenylcysteine O-methyltransferase Ste14